MALLQIKNLPDDVHAALAARAKAEATTMSDLAAGMIARELRDIDTIAALDGVRDDLVRDDLVRG
jgi:plasmid stability protein